MLHIIPERPIYKLQKTKKRQCPGVLSDGATPVPIPNTEVKTVSADDSRMAKVGRRQDNASFLIEIKNTPYHFGAGYFNLFILRDGVVCATSYASFRDVVSPNTLPWQKHKLQCRCR